MMGTVCNVGINDGKYKSSINGKHTTEYKHWKNMLERCYSHSIKERNPTYIGCSVSENFKSFSYFYEWCQNQIGFKNNNWHLDKDIITKGNKIYSEDVCLFIPREINQILVKSNATRGVYPIGVSFDKRRGLFESCMRANSGKKFLGYFSNEIDAHRAYKIAKELYIKEMARKWHGLIDCRAYDALMMYQVEITD